MSGTPPMPPDDPAPAPEWAVYMASEYLMSSRRDDGRLARLLATLRERTLREAADCAENNEYEEELRAAILSLIAQPPKPERSDGSEAEGREEAT